MSSARVKPAPKTGVMDIAAYVPGRETAPGVARVYKLSANESPLGSEPEGCRGPWPASPIISKSIRTAPRNHAAGRGRRSARAQSRPISCAATGPTTCLHCFARPIYRPATRASSRNTGSWSTRSRLPAPARRRSPCRRADCTVDVDAMLAAVTERTKIVFIANPNNPTGTYLPVEEVRRLHAGLPRDVLLVLDAAYAEYVRRNDYEAGIELVSANENVVMTRTFSKIYGLGCAAHRMALRSGNHCRCAQPHPRSVQRQCGRHHCRRRGDPRPRPCGTRRSPTTRYWLSRLVEGFRGARTEGDAAGRQFPADPFRRCRENGGGSRRFPDQPRLMCCAGSSAYGFDNALRMSVGSAGSQ